MILGTAGHIDHGKTALIGALTGIDTDRLPEEKKRGMTIDIGFARIKLGEYELGIVDVPGHERFIRNMVAGAAGIDLAMLVVAADDSVMPQTREHMGILQLLGVKHGLVVVTKSDLADDERLQLVELEIEDLVAGTFLEKATIIRTSATVGTGINELKQALAALCGAIEPIEDGELFRMPIDRSFVIQGQGTVVTGSVGSGSLQVGQEVTWFPMGKNVRIRSLESHGERSNSVFRGQRAAIGLVGVGHREIMRGHELASPKYLKPSRILTVQLQAISTNSVSIKHRTRVRLHIGTANVIASVSLLASNTLDPGQLAMAQLFLSEPVVAVCGQPFVIRRISPISTLGGGQVLKPISRRMRRYQSRDLTCIESLASTDSTTRAALAIRAFQLMAWTELDLCRDANLRPVQVPAILDELERRGDLVLLVTGPGKTTRLHREKLTEIGSVIIKAIKKFHASYPLELGMPRVALAEHLHMRSNLALLDELLDRLVSDNRVALTDTSVALVSFVPQLVGEQQVLYDRLISAYQLAGFQPPATTDLVVQMQMSEAELRQLINFAVTQRKLVHLGGALFLHVQVEQDLCKRVRDALCGAGRTVGYIRDVLGTSRKYAVPFCEYLDRIGLTKREGNLRVLAVMSSDGQSSKGATNVPPRTA